MDTTRLTEKAAFLKFASVCCFLTVVTTIGIHAFFQFDVNSVDDRVTLHHNVLYLVNRWWVILHCLLVIVAMWGFLLARFKQSPGYTGLGFLFFAVFGITEIFRQLAVLFYLNSLRDQYLATTDDVVRAALLHDMDNFGLLGYALFGLFIFAFAVGNLFYGVSLLRETGFSKIISIVLLIWALMTFVVLGNEFWENGSLSAFIEWFNVIYQPAARFLLGVWLWRAAR